MVEVLGLINRQNVLLLDMATDERAVISSSSQKETKRARNSLATMRTEFSVNHYRIEEILSRFMS